MISNILHHRHAQLPLVGKALRPAAPLADAGEDGEQDGGDHGDDAEDDKQLNQCEGAPAAALRLASAHPNLLIP
jgi:hypothetical protein